MGKASGIKDSALGGGTHRAGVYRPDCAEYISPISQFVSEFSSGYKTSAERQNNISSDSFSGCSLVAPNKAATQKQRRSTSFTLERDGGVQPALLVVLTTDRVLAVLC